jgi:uncharacterized protein YegL
MKDATDITIVLDRSGSMDSVKDDTIGGFNSFLAEQCKLESQANLTFIQFDSQDPFEVVHQAIPVKDVPNLDGNTFVPRGGTPLLDAMGQAINETGKRLADMPDAQRPDKVVIVVITDGMENSSQEFTRDQILKKVEHQTGKYDWQFVFLGANQDAIAAGASLGIARKSSMTYAANAAGSAALFESLSDQVNEYRTGAASSMAFTAKDRAKQKKAGA